MGKTADECFLQSRMLNRGKGPAVHSLRAQIDRRKYSTVMKHKLELQKNLELRQAEIVEIEKTEDGYDLTTRMLAVFHCKTVVIATGTYLGGRIFVGEVSYESGPDGIFPASFLGASLKKLGLPLRRFKTGTPARVLRNSIDYTDLEVQKGDEPPQPFSYETESLGENKVDCYISWTNDETKQIILENIHRSPLYAGKIEGMQEVLGCEAKRTAAEEKKTFHGILKDVISEEVEDAKTVILDIQQDLNDMVEEHKNVFENEPVLLTPPAIREAMAEKGLSEEVISKVEEICEEAFGDTPPLAENLIDSKALQTHAAAKKANVLALEVESLKQKLEEKEALPEKEVILQVSAEKLPAIQTEFINGKKCIVIPLEEDEHATINGKHWNNAPF